MNVSQFYKAIIAIAICAVVILLKQPAYLWALVILVFI